MVKCDKMVCPAILLGCSAIIFMIMGIQYINYLNFDNLECYVTNVTYPTSIKDYNNLITCNCGRHCKSDAGTCVRIYGYSRDNPNINMMFLETTQHPNRNKCSFAEVKCKEGELIGDRERAVTSAQQLAKHYIGYIGTNNTIDCFQRHNNSNLYLKNDYSFISILVSGIIFGIFLLLFIFICLS